MRHHGQRGQAAVESALVLPLGVFLVLGMLQLFMMFQGRVMAQYAVARATRMGSVGHGDCVKMRHTAVAALLPTFARTDNAVRLANAFDARQGGRYDPALDNNYSESIFWLTRVRPLAGELSDLEEETFDLPGREPRMLEVRMVFWYPLRIPFANWVISSITLAHMQVLNFTNTNPLMLTQERTNWWGTGSYAPMIANELLQRTRRRHYVVPIDVSYTMRMMTPARADNFAQPTCEPFP
jgi:hypothetical protein